jgi:hypothetical protein
MRRFALTLAALLARAQSQHFLNGRREPSEYVCVRTKDLLHLLHVASFSTAALGVRGPPWMVGRKESAWAFS